MHNLFQLENTSFQKKLIIYYQWMIVIGICILTIPFFIAKFYLTALLHVFVALSFIPCLKTKYSQWKLTLLRFTLLTLSFIIL